MITHVVLFKLGGCAEKTNEAVGLLRGLMGKVPVLRDLEVGVDVVGAERSYTIALIARFDTLADLDAYRVHPEHRKVARYMKEVSELVAAVDYETDSERD